MKCWLKLAIAVVIFITAAFLCYQITNQKVAPEQANGKQAPILKPTPTPNPTHTNLEEVIDPFKYTRKVETINGNRQVIYTITVDLTAPEVNVQKVLSHNSIFGFEKTHEMAQRTDAKAAINGGFFHIYGQPSGITVIDEKLICTPYKQEKRAVFMIDEHRNAAILDMRITVYIQLNDDIMLVDGINRHPHENEIIVFTPEYGFTTRTNGIDTYNIVVNDQRVNETIQTADPVGIPRDGLVISANAQAIKKLQQFKSAQQGSNLSVETFYKSEPSVSGILQAFEGGFWVVREGEIVVKSQEGWVGFTTNREPRTAIGIKKSGEVVLIAIDGRQPGHSIGVTGRELGQYLLENDILNALMLDGGASTTVVLAGEVVNKPSYRGRERVVGGAVVVRIDSDR